MGEMAPKSGEPCMYSAIPMSGVVPRGVIFSLEFRLSASVVVAATSSKKMLQVN